MTLLDEYIAVGIAGLERVIEPPTGPLGYGIDLDCIADVTEDFDEIDPNSPRAIVQGVIRIWTTPRGALADDPNYGIDLRSYCNRGMSTTDARSLAVGLAGEAKKDDRVSDITVELTASARQLDVKARIWPADPALQPFSFTFAVTDAQVLLDTLTIQGA